MEFQQIGILTSLETPNDGQSDRIFKQPAKAPIRLRLCAGWYCTYHIVGNLKSRLKF